jgi:hypothetical protein
MWIFDYMVADWTILCRIFNIDEFFHFQIVFLPVVACFNMSSKFAFPVVTHQPKNTPISHVGTYQPDRLQLVLVFLTLGCFWITDGTAWCCFFIHAGICRNYKHKCCNYGDIHFFADDRFFLFLSVNSGKTKLLSILFQMHPSCILLVAAGAHPVPKLMS